MEPSEIDLALRKERDQLSSLPWKFPGDCFPLLMFTTDVSTVALNLAGSDIKMIETTTSGPV
jgi:hypothetical protein